MRIKRNGAITLICIILGIILATQFRSVYNNKKKANLENMTLNELREDLYNQRKINDDLSRRNIELFKQVNDYETQISGYGKSKDNLKLELDRARTIAGLNEVKGKGVVIKLDNNEPAYVSEDNLLDILNELRASDAQAISINDERVVAMTEVKDTGRYMVINGKQMIAPFTIKAIADPEKLEHTLQMIGGVKERLEEHDFLLVSIEKSEDINIPAVVDDGSVIKIDLLTPVAQ